ncbi:hypothetical protein HAX54_015893 [Datura stramonium]|uniref:Uncharacterized protein n=1 Tax=Datura stramonium TaxID=4076 RepID=A0ABS8S309_DATST|nr:hypothetical protein [Datura stramonium]
MDEVIRMTSGYSCRKRRKWGTVGYLLNQSSDKPSITTTGGEAKLRRQLRFLLASFLATSLSSGRLGSTTIAVRNPQTIPTGGQNFFEYVLEFIRYVSKTQIGE